MRFILWVLANGLLAFFCCCVGVGDWLSKTQVFGGFSDWGDIRVPGGLLGYLRVRVLSLRPVFHSCQSPTLLNCFGSGDAILGSKIAYFLFGLQYSPVICSDLGVWHSPEAFDCVNCSGMTGLIGCWEDALSLSKSLTSPDLSGSLFMGSGSNAAEPRFPE